ncbi:MAG: endonuclease/exonuclease/phosphatase family protein [Bacteroidota bacterium]
MKLVFGLNIIFALLLACSCLAPFISPEKIWFFAFAGLAYQPLALINLGFVIFWLIFKRIYLLLSLIMLMAGYNHVRSHFQFRETTGKPEKGSYTRVLSYNVRNFDIYNVDKKWKHDFTNRNRIFTFIKDQMPDIICFQEFVNDLSGTFKTLDTLVQFQKAKYCHAEYKITSRNINQFGIATFSAYPIVNKGKIDFPWSRSNLCIWTDVLIGKDTVRIYNAHFESIRLSKEETELAENPGTVSENKDNEALKRTTKKMFDYMKAAYKRRSREAEMVSDHILNCHFPVILCTDLNDTPCSYAYHHISHSLTDAFVRSGSGTGSSYPGFPLPFRIDYIFYSDPFSAINFKTHKLMYSDHYPITCDFVKD